MDLYTEENKAKVDAWLADPRFRAIVEFDTGTPVKVKVLWERGVIQIRGPLLGKEIPILNVLDAMRSRMH